MIKNILARILAIWSALAFIGSMLLVLLPIWAAGIFGEPTSTAWMIRLSRFWMSIYFPLSFIKVSITGKENFQPNENYIVVCNHNSFMDVPLSSPGIPGPNKTIAKVEMSRIPLFGIIYKRGSILINRKDENSRKESYQKMKDVLDAGMHMCIYPEGTRNKTDQPMKAFHDGAFKLSMETGKKIIPAIIKGTKEMLPNNKTLYFWPGKISMEFLSPIDPKEFGDVTALKEYVFKKMMEKLTRY
ncbi:MAG: 1-acyl-sn-glycerol-3-phosphate acyltransferase [Chitinophagia bacterium]|jgi:1-acyl-sn-glycerol-3-phosphate acyltransferase|nr:1-acyl-sn-glycerol-3-phosphate acyltransferase [Chitinophagia bacterium]